MPRPNPYAARISRCASTTGTQGGNCWAADPTARAGLLVRPRPARLARGGTSFAGLEAIGVPAESLATFPSEFQQGMAARADYIGDVGESAPENWEAPLGSKDVHVVVAALARDTPHGGPGQAGAGRGPQPARRHPVWTLDVHVPPDGRGSSASRTRSVSRPSRAPTSSAATRTRHRSRPASFVLGYQDERRRVAGSAAGGAGPQRHVRGLPQAAPAGGGLPPVLGQNAARRRRARSGLAAKFVGAGRAARRWRLAPERDDPNWAPIRSGTTPFMYARRPRGDSSARSARTPVG
jgi:hypothetical protein